MLRQVDSGAIQAKFVRFVFVMIHEHETETFTPYFSVLCSYMYVSYLYILLIRWDIRLDFR